MLPEIKSEWAYLEAAQGDQHPADAKQPADSLAAPLLGGWQGVEQRGQPAEGGVCSPDDLRLLCAGLCSGRIVIQPLLQSCSCVTLTHAVPDRTAGHILSRHCVCAACRRCGSAACHLWLWAKCAAACRQAVPRARLGPSSAARDQLPGATAPAAPARHRTQEVPMGCPSRCSTHVSAAGAARKLHSHIRTTWLRQAQRCFWL